MRNKNNPYKTNWLGLVWELFEIIGTALLLIAVFLAVFVSIIYGRVYVATLAIKAAWGN